MKEILDVLEMCPIIAAVKGEKLHEAIKSSAEIIFLLNANLLSIDEQIDFVHQHNRKLFVHIDLAEGIGKDKTGIEFLAKNNVDGIISTHSSLIRIAKQEKLSTVQRVFALDSQGVSGAAEVIKSANPDFVEVMPGVAYKVINKLSGTNVPIIAGGLIETKNEVINALNSGAVAVSTGKIDLWNE